ncbi:MAG: DUF6498-containing protein [Acidobacteria bacterium]|jgi:hypothetical protein|nr:DUF6498-containing protein [Acidobacteriota bacterium]
MTPQKSPDAGGGDANTALSAREAFSPANGGHGIPLLFQRLQSSALALIVANMVPLYGVMALHWKVGPILVFYWVENLAVGFFNLFKMARARGPIGDSHMTLNNRPVTEDSRKALMFFFAMHYGGFTLGHGVFVMVMFAPGMTNILSQSGLAFLVLFFSHGYSYWRNFIGRGEFQRVSFARLFWQPYARVIIMHLTILAGGALAASMGSPMVALMVLIGLKTLIDLSAHWLERRKFGETAHARIPV